MSVHENDTTRSTLSVSGEPTLQGVTAGEAAIEAFKLALKELGVTPPANPYRVVLARAGLLIEVEALPETTVEHYGTPTAIEEIAAFIGDGASPTTFRDGDTVRVTGRSTRHRMDLGDLLTLTRADVDSDGDVFAKRNRDGQPCYITPADIALVTDTPTAQPLSVGSDLDQPEELDALPVGAEVRDRDGDTWKKFAEGWDLSPSTSPAGRLNRSAAYVLRQYGPVTRTGADS